MQSTRSGRRNDWTAPARPAVRNRACRRDANGDQFVGLYGSDGPTPGFRRVDGAPVFVGLMGIFHTLSARGARN